MKKPSKKTFGKILNKAKSGKDDSVSFRISGKKKADWIKRLKALGLGQQAFFDQTVDALLEGRLF